MDPSRPHKTLLRQIIFFLGKLGVVVFPNSKKIPLNKFLIRIERH